MGLVGFGGRLTRVFLGKKMTYTCYFSNGTTGVELYKDIYAPCQTLLSTLTCIFHTFSHRPNSNRSFKKQQEIEREI